MFLYCFQTSAILTAVVSQGDFKCGTRICTCKSLGGVCLPTHCFFQVYVPSCSIIIASKSSRHRAGLVQAAASLMLQVQQRHAGRWGDTRALLPVVPWVAVWSWCQHSGDILHSFGLFGSRVFADGMLPSESHSPKVFLFEIIMARPQGSDLTWSWVSHLIPNEKMILEEGTSYEGGT